MKREPIAAAARVVVKVGTRVLTRPDGGIALSRLFSVVESLAALATAGREAILVTSGAVGLGASALELGKSPEDLVERQACAAVGQTLLMELYQQGFSRLDRVCAQVLLTEGDFDDRARYLNLRGTLSELLRRGAIPIINENDAVSTAELAFIEGEDRPVFGDNDGLAALVSAGLEADLLILLTDVKGVFPGDPDAAGATVLEQIDSPEKAALAVIDSADGVSRGGMRSKLAAAATARNAGCHTIIASGLDGALDRVLAGEPIGTWIPAAEADVGARRWWIGRATAARGRLILDRGAVLALVERGASLLAAGVRQIEGEFRADEAVELVDEAGVVIGRGLVGCDSSLARAWVDGHRPPGVRNHHALVHRDHLVLTARPPEPPEPR